MIKTKLEITSRNDEADRKAILDPLVKHNEAIAGQVNYIPLNVLLRDNRNVIVGGLWGHTAYGWFTINLLYVPEGLRRQGMGGRIVSSAENEATARGCMNVWLDTHEFQARGFYESLGYDCFGELPDYPTGYARYFMRKTLD